MLTSGGVTRLPLFFEETPVAPEDPLSFLADNLAPFCARLDSEEMEELFTSLLEVVSQDTESRIVLSVRRRTLFERLERTESYDELAALHAELNESEMEEFLHSRSVISLHRRCTDYRDGIARKVISLVERETGWSDRYPPYALISMGSDGREEQTLITDQDNLIVYGDGGGNDADEYYRRFSETLVERLAQVGFKKCTGDIMPSNPTWRGSYSQWRRKLFSIVRYEYDDYKKNLMDLIVLSDARHVGGDPLLAGELITLIRELERDHFQVLYGMAKAASEMRLALGFLKRLWTEGSGEHKGEFNLKLLAWAPLVMNVRILAINQAIPATNTIERIRRLVDRGGISPTMGEGLIEGYDILTRHRILAQIRVIKGIQNDSYYLNPYTLPADERERLRQALLRIEELQKLIHVNFHVM